MHINQAYSAEASEDIILKIIRPLRKGTEIEELLVDKYNMFKNLVQGRIGSLSQEMLDAGLLEREAGGSLQRVAAFDSVWKDREIYWKKHEPEPAARVMPPKPIASNVESDDSESSDGEARRNITSWTISAGSTEQQSRGPKVKPSVSVI